MGGPLFSFMSKSRPHSDQVTLDVLDVMLELQADPHIRAPDGTSLLLAIGYSRSLCYPVLNRLKSLGFDINQPDPITGISYVNTVSRLSCKQIETLYDLGGVFHKPAALLDPHLRPSRSLKKTLLLILDSSQNGVPLEVSLRPRFYDLIKQLPVYITQYSGLPEPGLGRLIASYARQSFEGITKDLLVTTCHQCFVDLSQVGVIFSPVFVQWKDSSYCVSLCMSLFWFTFLLRQPTYFDAFLSLHCRYRFVSEWFVMCDHL